MNIGELVRYWARWRPEHAAIIHNDRRVNWRELDRMSDDLARGLLQAGVAKGDRVGLLISNRIEAPVVAIASLKVGALLVPLNYRLTGPEILPLLEDAECKLVITEAEYLRNLEPAAATLDFATYVIGSNDAPGYEQLVIGAGATPHVDVGYADPGFICYTSGTTGRQKGALLTHGSALYPGLAKNTAEGLTWRDSMMMAVPFVFTGAVISCFIQFAVAAGGTLVLESNFDVDRYLDVIRRHRVTAATTVPVIWERLLRSPEFATSDLSFMVSAAAGGAPVSIDLIEAYQRKGVSLIQSYGLTEASGLVATMHAEDALHRIGWAGRAIAGTEIRIADENGQTLPLGEAGEILVRGPHVMQGYWRKPDITAETIVDGWLRTGDLGQMDEDGFVKIVDRSKDMLISGGINVYPAEIERALGEVAGVTEFAVIGVPDKDWGEVPMIVVQAHGDRDAVAGAIRLAAEATLAKFKRPKHLVFIEGALPRTLSGKVSKPSLRGDFRELPDHAIRLF